MLRKDLRTIVSSAIRSACKAGDLPQAVLDLPVGILDTKQPEHGDFSCAFAMTSSKTAGKPPRAVAEILSKHLIASDSVDRPVFQAVEIAGPGFLNLRIHPAAIARYIPLVLEAGHRFGETVSTPENPRKRINVEFVSVNPNGPITVGSGRGAAFGDTLCRVLSAAGNIVYREYYINDGVNSEQMRQFALSVKAYAENQPLPEKAYRGEYVKDVSAAIVERGGFEGRDALWWQQRAQEKMIERQRGDLSLFGVEFDTWFSEQSLHDSGYVTQCLDELAQKGVADTEPYRIKVKFGKGGVVEEVTREAQTIETDDEDEGAFIEGVGDTLWLRSTLFGDDMDRVLRRRDGRLTYISSDIAYHRDKFNRPPSADQLITVLGPDHHGYIGRLHAVLAATFRSCSDSSEDANATALQQARKRLDVVIFQIVRFVKDGQPAPMRKRDGNIYELRDLIQELGRSSVPDSSPEDQERIGRDVARFFYLMRSHETHMDFDIDLATKQSDENPVFYVQYAHARVCSVVRKAEETGLAASSQPEHLTLLVDSRELNLLKKILDLPYEVERAAEDYGVHRLTTYCLELARAYHHFYDGCRVLQPGFPELSAARLDLCRAARTALKSALGLLGISAPERMDRVDPSATMS